MKVVDSFEDRIFIIENVKVVDNFIIIIIRVKDLSRWFYLKDFKIFDVDDK